MKTKHTTELDFQAFTLRLTGIVHRRVPHLPVTAARLKLLMLLKLITQSLT